MPLIDEAGEGTADGLIPPAPCVEPAGSAGKAGTPAAGNPGAVGGAVRVVFITAIRRRNSWACCNLELGKNKINE